MLDLIELVHSNNLLTRPLGVSVREKARGGGLNPRIYMLLVLFWLDTIQTSLLVFIPTEQEELLILLSDFAFLYFDKMRYFFFAVPLFYRVSSALMVTCFVLVDFHWLSEANRIFEQLKSEPLYRRIEALKRRCQLAAFVVVLSRGLLIVIVGYLTSSYIPAIRARNAKYSLVHSYIYLVYYSFVYTGVNYQFMMELYFLCGICTELFKQLNHKFSRALFHRKQLHYFALYNSQYSLICLFVHRVMSYVKPIYIIYFLCNLVVTIFIMYVALFVSHNILLQCFYMTFISIEMLTVVFFSRAIGHIEVRGKQLADQIYSAYIVNDMHKAYTSIFKSKILQYLHSVWCGNISLVILGNPINSSTCIKVLTIVLTVIAFIISNFRN